MDIIINEIRKNIFLLTFKNQYEATSTFMRLQEYYESPYKGIKNCCFTLEEYMDRYAKENGNFTYNEDWSGFNVPDNIVRNFFKIFGDNLLEKEKELYGKIEFLINDIKNFYLIGVYKDEDLNHEIAHGYYYLDSIYKNNMDINTSLIDTNIIRNIKKVLKKFGYCKEVLNDEIQAYLSTEKDLYLKNILNFDVSINITKKYREVFKEKDKNGKCV